MMQEQIEVMLEDAERKNCLDERIEKLKETFRFGECKVVYAFLMTSYYDKYLQTGNLHNLKEACDYAEVTEMSSFHDDCIYEKELKKRAIAVGAKLVKQEYARELNKIKNREQSN